MKDYPLNHTCHHLSNSQMQRVVYTSAFNSWVVIDVQEVSLEHEVSIIQPGMCERNWQVSWDHAWCRQDQIRLQIIIYVTCLLGRWTGVSACLALQFTATRSHHHYMGTGSSMCHRAQAWSLRLKYKKLTSFWTAGQIPSGRFTVKPERHKRIQKTIFTGFFFLQRCIYWNYIVKNCRKFYCTGIRQQFTNRAIYTCA